MSDAPKKPVKKTAAKRPTSKNGKGPVKMPFGRLVPFRQLTRGQKVRRVLMWAGLAVALLIILFVIVLVIAYQKTSIPDANKEFQAQTTYVYYNNGKAVAGQFALQNRDSISYDQMPQDIKDAVVSAENRTFWTDHGIDPKSILRAAFSNARGNATQGASTITQQYVKILYLNQERTYTRKIKEAMLSLKIERTMSKQQILEGYLNTIYFGRGAYGIQAASEAYFNEPAAKLTVNQAAALAAIINSPSTLDPTDSDDAAQRLLSRYRYVLDGMEKTGSITAAQAAKYEKALPKFPAQKQSDQYGGQRGHTLTLVKKELLSLGFTDDQIEGGGLRVTTTLSQKDMLAIANAVKAQKPTGFSDKELHIGVASVQVGTGALLGFWGGQDFLQSQINWAATGGMIGSTMKPVTLATALEAGYSLKSTFDGNSPYVFPSGLKVHNEGENAGMANGQSYGAKITATYALQESVNTAYVDMTMAIPNGPQAIYNNALKMGLPPSDAANSLYPGIPNKSVDLDPKDTLITLGKTMQSPINMANTYATIANGGERANVHIIDKVTDATGKVLYSFENVTTSAIPQPIADDVSYALQQVVKSGTGAHASTLGRPAGGKTGTANNGAGRVSSAWFVGFTPQVSTAVMYVRGNGTEGLDGWLPSYFGADYPTRTWVAAMQGVLSGDPTLQFPPPANVQGAPPTNTHDPIPSKTPSQKPKPTKSATVGPTCDAAGDGGSTLPPCASQSPTDGASETDTSSPSADNSASISGEPSP